MYFFLNNLIFTDNYSATGTVILRTIHKFIIKLINNYKYLIDIHATYILV